MLYKYSQQQFHFISFFYYFKCYSGKPWIYNHHCVTVPDLYPSPQKLHIKSNNVWNWVVRQQVGFTQDIVTVFSSVTQSCLTLCEPMDCSMQGFPVHHQLLEFTQTHVLRVGDAIQPSHPLSSLTPSTFNLSQRQGLFQRVSSSHQVAKGLEFHLQH